MRQIPIYLSGVFASLVFAGTLSADDDFMQWMQQQQQGVLQQKQEFQAYKDARDKEFTAFLKAQWKPVDLLKGEVRDTAPKPVTLPVAPPVPEKPPEKPPENLPEQQLEKPVVKQPVIIEPPVTPPPPRQPQASVPETHRGTLLQVDFYGRSLKFYYDPSLAKRLIPPVNKDSISRHWSTLSRQDYPGLVAQLARQKKALKLNDWAFAGLVHQVAGKITGHRAADTALLSWFLLIKSGYQARVAYDSNRIYLLVPSEQELFDISYFTFDGVRFYAVDFNGDRQKPGRVFTYDGRYPGASREFDMHVDATVAANDVTGKRRLHFNFEGKPYEVSVAYDRGRVGFLQKYPQLGLPLYFEAGVNYETAAPLQKQLAAYMQGMDELQAVNFLLRFVQTAFAYKTDEQQFGEENYLFPEETLYYPYSDCEDRSILFAWLVHSLLKLDVVGLDYPGHVATAVRFSRPVTGDAIEYKGQRYTVSDPTYINAVAGMTMPDYKGKQPGIIAY